MVLVVIIGRGGGCLVQVKVLRCVTPVCSEDVVFGQYEGDPNAHGEASQGYRDDPTVPNDSRTPTFATAIVHVENERWEGELREWERSVGFFSLLKVAVARDTLWSGCGGGEMRCGGGRRHAA